MAKEKKVNEETNEETENVTSNEKIETTDTNEKDIKIKELEDKNMRLQAEFINYRTRNEQEKTLLFKYEGENLVKQILEVVDDFERAIKMDDNDLSDEVSNFLKGFKMIYTRLIGILDNLGVKEVIVEGKEFDPNLRT